MASFDVEEMHITSINVCLIKSNKWVSIVQTLLKYICKTKKYYIKKIYDYLNQYHVMILKKNMKILRAIINDQNFKAKHISYNIEKYVSVFKFLW